MADEEVVCEEGDGVLTADEEVTMVVEHFQMLETTEQMRVAFEGIKLLFKSRENEEREKEEREDEIKGEVVPLPTDVLFKLQVYASDNDRLVARFSHPNNTQGIGIAWDGLLALGTNPSQDIIIRARGPNGIVDLSTNGLTRLRVLGNGSVEIPFGGVSVTGGGQQL
jgi:hypothetical protein